MLRRKSLFVPFAALSIGTAPDLAAQNWFGAPQTDRPNGDYVGAADLDLDGDVDLLRNVFGLEVQVYLNDGGGTFTPAATFEVFSGSVSDASGFSIGDVDGDGLPDVVNRAGGSGTGSGFTVNFNLGNATFGPPLFTVTGDLGRDVALGQADGTPALEVVASFGAIGASNDHVAWFSWTGSSFTPGPAFATGTLTGNLAAGDLNGDGLDDVAVGTFFSNEVLVAHSLPGGGFAQQPSLFVPAVQGVTVLVHAADPDGDGDDDLVAIDSGIDEAAIAVFLSDGAGGVSGLQTYVHPQRLETQRIAFGDLDGDGDDDLVTRRADFGGTNPLVVLEAFAGGDYQFGFQEGRLPGNAGAVADLDGDGHADVTLGKTILWGDGELASPYTADHPFPAYSLRAFDWEGDGDLDLRQVGGEVDRLAIRVNDGTGTFTSTGPLLPLQVTGQSYDDVATVRDFDGDGVRDVVTGSSQFLFGPPATTTFLAEWRYLGTGAGTFAPDGNAAPPVGTDVAQLERSPVDVDGDGSLDLVESGGSVWINDGAGVFDELPGAYVGTWFEDAGDVDGDGDADLLTRGPAFTNPDLVLQRNDGSGGFTAEVLLADTGIQGGARLFDLDEDGDLDVVGFVTFSSFANQSVFLLENLGGTFGAPAPLGIVQQTATRHFHVDVDLDGRRDLVSMAQFGGTTHEVAVFRRASAGLSFDAPRLYLMRDVADFGDLDGDGDVDVLGGTVFRSGRADPAVAGSIRQYGAGVAGTGGAVPVLGSTGPLAVGGTVELRVRHALGGTVALLAVGTAETALANLPFGGLTLYSGGSIVLYTLTLGGTAGAAAQGALDLPVFVDPSLAGTTRHLQLFPVDPASTNGLLTQSNGLELSFGS